MFRGFPPGFAVCLAASVGFAVSAGAVWSQSGEPRQDLLTLAAGAVLVSASADPAGALALTDGDPDSTWSSSTRKLKPPYVFVLELIAPADLTDVGIAGAGTRPGGVTGGSAGPVTVEGSAAGPDRGWRPLARFDAAPEGVTTVPTAPGEAVRWLKFTIDGGQAPDVAWVYLSETIAYGNLVPPSDSDRFSGVFQTGRADFVELHQTGSEVSGCYVENGGRSTGTISGAVQDGVALVNWVSDAAITGSAFLTIDSAGALAGVRYRQRSRSHWGGPVAPEGTVTPCSPKAAAAAVPEKDPIVAALESLGEVRLYGIHFEYDSDVPKPSATPALERLHAALASAPGLSVDIEGHTDADGGDTYNLDLSQRRAASVVAWLVARGIAADRLAPVGKGETVPVASNATADGKALNRRVEIRRR